MSRNCRDMYMTTSAMGSESAITEDRLHGIYRPGCGSSPPDWAALDEYPRLTNISAGFLYKHVLRALAPEAPEYVTVPYRGRGLETSEALVAIVHWNQMWEAAQFRRRALQGLTGQMLRVADQGDNNVVFVPRTQSRYYEYAPLFHLLPPTVLERHGLPLIRTGTWPFLTEGVRIDPLLPPDFEKRLARAWAGAVWHHLMSGSEMRGFTETDPIRLIAHNLDFWLPPVTAVIEDLLRAFPTVESDIQESVALLEDGTVLAGAIIVPPRMGGDIWRGAAFAEDVLQQVVETADANGRLRAILDAVRSNRVEEDFSEHWTFAREDFERKLYRKRNKVQVKFVELTDTIPVLSPETEVIGQISTAEFMALLDPKQQQIVILLTSGHTKLVDVARIMGYANHSPISKHLSRIRTKAEDYFGLK